MEDSPVVTPALQALMLCATVLFVVNHYVWFTVTICELLYYIAT